MSNTCGPLSPTAQQLKNNPLCQSTGNFRNLKVDIAEIAVRTSRDCNKDLYTYNDFNFFESAI